MESAVQRRTLTVLGIRKMKPPSSGRSHVYDSVVPQLQLRITSSGHKSFCVRTRIGKGGPLVRKTLGDAAVLDVDEARDLARDVLKYAKRGVDIIEEREREAERQARDSAQARANTVDAVAERFFVSIGAKEREPGSEPTKSKPRKRGNGGARKEDKKLKTAKEVKRTLERFLLEKFGTRPITDITRRELIQLFDDIAEENGPIAANRALAWTKRFFKYAISKDDVTANPAADIAKPGKERKRKRTLNDGEIREVWAAADTLGYPYGHFTKALLLTGRRKTSVAMMRRSEIDPARRVWIPGEADASGESENKSAPELPLFTALEALLASIPEEKAAGGDYVFSTQTKRTVPINSSSAAKTKLDEAIAKARNAAGIGDPMPAWILHDLRRTVKTRLAELQVPKELRDLIMGHARQGMDAVYDHSEQREPKRAALEKWAAGIGRILRGEPFDPIAGVRPDNVVDFPAAANA